MDEPAVEKISEDSREDPFQVLIATMLSAQTRDAVTHAASTRLFRVGADAADDGARCRRRDRAPDLSRSASIATKARHVREACRQILDAVRRTRAGSRWRIC